MPPKTVDPADVKKSLRYVTTIRSSEPRECTPEEERAAIYEYDAGMTRDLAEILAGYRPVYTDPVAAERDEMNQLRRLHPFANMLVYWTRKSILTDWMIGLKDNGCTLFWYQDRIGRFINAKVVHYPGDGFHRSKNQKPFFLYTEADGFGQCLYGEHQLSPNFLTHRQTRYDANSKIILVESEKTAIIMSHHLPKYIWLATGGSTGLTESKARVLKSREVFIAFDNDQDGAGSTVDAQRKLSCAGAKPHTLRIGKLFPDAPKKADFADCIVAELQKTVRSE